MEQHKGYRLVKTEDLQNAKRWVAGLEPEDPQMKEAIYLLRDTLLTALEYATVVAEQMGGLPCFSPGMTQKERAAAMKAAAQRARKPGGGKHGRQSRFE